MTQPAPPDYYSILGVRPDATRQEIERAYDRLSATYQPDAAKAPVDPKRMDALNEAFDVLDDPGRRAGYDERRSHGGASPKVAAGRQRLRAKRYGRLALALGGIALIATVGVAAVIAISGGSDSASPSVTGPTLAITSPANGATVSSPVVVSVESEGIEIAPADAGVEGAAHYHAFVDIHPFTPAGQLIPDGQRIHHFASESLELDLEPGVHSIIVAFGDNADIRLQDAPVDAIEITVE
jgi:hypothetical protein